MEELPQTNINRNFAGVKKGQYYSLAELQMGDMSGNTETDGKTEQPTDHRYKGAPKGGGGYTTINKKIGKAHNG